MPWINGYIYVGIHHSWFDSKSIPIRIQTGSPLMPGRIHTERKENPSRVQADSGSSPRESRMYQGRFRAGSRQNPNRIQNEIVPAITSIGQWFMVLTSRDQPEVGYIYNIYYICRTRADTDQTQIIFGPDIDQYIF
jgi:hypothetical protein